jgi:hypothetical protein
MDVMVDYKDLNELRMTLAHRIDFCIYPFGGQNWRRHKWPPYYLIHLNLKQFLLFLFDEKNKFNVYFYSC